MSDNALGARIRELREERGWTQIDLALAAEYQGKSPVTISRIENGHLQPSPASLRRIADALGVASSELEALRSVRRRAVLRDETSGGRPPVGKRGVSGHARALVAGSQAQRNYERQQRIADEVEFLNRTNDTKVERFQEAQTRAVEDLLVPFFNLARNVSGIEVSKEGEVITAGPNLSVEQRIAFQRTDLRRQLFAVVGATAGGAGVGAAAGLGAGALVYTITAGLASASTGTAIATLSGAAATSATLAALGGGSLATGGLGMAGGAALLSGVVAAPVLIATGAVLAYKGRALRRQAGAESDRLDMAEEALEASKRTLARAWDWSDRAAAVLRRARLFGRPEIAWLEDSIKSAGGSLDITSADDEFVTRFDRLTSLVVTVLSVLSLRIFASSASDEQDDDEFAAVPEWNDRVLTDASAQLGALMPEQ